MMQLLVNRWNPSTEDQAIDRVHRLGQTQEVTVYRLICRDTVEERLLALQVHLAPTESDFYLELTLINYLIIDLNLI